MDRYRVIEVKEAVRANNDRRADELRAAMKERGQFLVNLMSSPTSTSTSRSASRTCTCATPRRA